MLGNFRVDCIKASNRRIAPPINDKLFLRRHLTRLGIPGHSPESNYVNQSHEIDLTYALPYKGVPCLHLGTDIVVFAAAVPLEPTSYPQGLCIAAGSSIHGISSDPVLLDNVSILWSTSRTDVDESIIRLLGYLKVICARTPLENSKLSKSCTRSPGEEIDKASAGVGLYDIIKVCTEIQVCEIDSDSPSIRRYMDCVYAPQSIHADTSRLLVHTVFPRVITTSGITRLVELSKYVEDNPGDNDVWFIMGLIKTSLSLVDIVKFWLSNCAGWQDP